MVQKSEKADSFLAYFVFEQVEDILFAAGEALAFLWGSVPVTTEMILRTNYCSLSASSNFLMADISSSMSSSKRMDSDNNEDYHGAVRDAITRKLFDGLLYSNKKEERCAGTVWLLSLTMYCGHHPIIQKLLPDIQVCHFIMKPCKVLNHTSCSCGYPFFFLCNTFLLFFFWVGW